VAGYVLSASFSPDGRYALPGGEDGAVKLWDAETGALLKAFYGHGGAVRSAAFSPDGKYLVSNGSDNTVRIWEAESGRPVRTIADLLGYPASLSYSTDGKRILAGAMDGTVRLYNAADGKEVAQFVGFTDKEWVAITPEGYYNASVRGDARINVLTDSTVYGIDSYRSTFYNPRILEARLAGRTDPAPAGRAEPAIQNAAAFTPPVVVIRSPQNGAGLNAGRTELSVSVADQNQPLKTIRVLVNGRLAGSDELAGLSGSKGLTVRASTLEVSGNENRVDFRFPLNLQPGLNRIEVIAANPYSEGRDTVEVNCRARAGGTLLPNLWFLAIGVNRYDDPAIPNLDYAVADARDIIEVFKAQQGKLYRQVNSLLIADGAAVAPTAENIRNNLGFLRQAGQRDVVMLFISGLGVNDEGDSYFFLPSDAGFDSGGGLRQSRAIPNRDIRSILDVPGQKLVFIDSCHSEGTSGRKTKAVENNSLVRELMDAGTVIFTSSRGSELSQERKEYGHGVFTCAIIQGMKGEADLIKNGVITMKELDTYVSETVPRLTGGAQHPTTDTPDGYVNFSVANVK
jgi:hypothetical protein